MLFFIKMPRAFVSEMGNMLKKKKKSRGNWVTSVLGVKMRVRGVRGTGEDT